MDLRGTESKYPFLFLYFPGNRGFQRREHNASLQSSMRKLQYPSYTKNGILTKPTEDEYDNGYSMTNLHAQEQSSTPYPVTQLLEKQFTRSPRALNHIWCTEEDRGEKEERIQNDFTDEQGYSYDYHEEPYLDGEEGFCSHAECALAAGNTVKKSPRSRTTLTGSPENKHKQIVCESLNNEDKIENKEPHESTNIKVESSLPILTPFVENQFKEVPAVTVKDVPLKTETNSKSDIHHKPSGKLVELSTDHSSNISCRTELNKVAESSTEGAAKIHQHESISINFDMKVKEVPKCSEDRRIDDTKRGFFASNKLKMEANCSEEALKVSLSSSTDLQSREQDVHYDSKGEQVNSQIDSEDLCTDHPIHSVDAEAFGSLDEEYYRDDADGKDNIPTDGQGDGGRYSYGIRQYLNMPTFMLSIKKFATDNKFELKDVPPDGNCMFKAIEDQLNINGDLGYTPKVLRETAVRYLRNNPCQRDGSRLEAFLHTESWEEYLTRMKQNYQWGDHMTLKALADALNLTVVVFNVYEDDVRRTEIPSEGNPVTKRQRQTVFLGHIGEFHYLSLRPTDWELEWPYKALIRRLQVNCQEKDQQQLLRLVEQKIGKKATKIYLSEFLSGDMSSNKGEENAFVPDVSSCFVKYGSKHLQLDDSEETMMALTDDPLSSDAVTGLTFPHFSFILNLFERSMIGNACFGNLDDSKVDYLGTNLVLILYGAAVDGTNVYFKNLSPEIKMQYEIRRKVTNYPSLIVFHPEENVIFSNDTKQAPGVNCVYADESETHPGYCRLKPVFNSKSIWFSLPTILNGETYVKAHNISDNVKEYFRSMKITKLFCGCKCISFPSSVRREWQYQENNTQCWPSTHVKQMVMTSRCLVIQKAHPTSRLPEVEWKYVFAEGEKILLKKGLTLFQKRLFPIFKLLVEHTIRNSQRPLKSKHLKNVFFYACENISAESFEANIGGCLIYLLAYLLNCLRTRCIPHYFIAKNNLLDNYSKGELHELCINIEALRVFPVQSLKHLFDAYGWKSVLTSRLKVLQDCEHFSRTGDINHSWTKVFIPAIIKSITNLIQIRRYEIAYDCLKSAYEEILLAPLTSDPPSFQDFFLETLNTLEDYTDKRNLAKFYDYDCGTDILAETRNQCVLVRDIVDFKVDEKVGSLEVPKYVAHNILDLANWLDEKAWFSYMSGGFDMAKEFLLTAINCVKGLLKEHMGFAINELTDETLRAEIKRHSSIAVSSLVGFYHHLFIACSPFKNYDILREQLKDLEKFRSSVPMINEVIVLIKSLLKGNHCGYMGPL